MYGFARAFCLTCILTLCAGPAATRTPETAKQFRISAVQENQVWIEGGLIDGLDQEMEGEIAYEISVAGQRKRIIPAKVRLTKVEDRDSIGLLYELSGVVNIGYSAQFTPKQLNELLLPFNSRASASYAGKDFNLAMEYYQRILQILPNDAFATNRVKDCRTQLEKQDAVMRERRNIPYYRDVIRVSLESDSVENRTLAGDYIAKILSIDPEDQEALKFKEALSRPASSAVEPALAETSAPATQPPPQDSTQVRSVADAAAEHVPVLAANPVREPQPEKPSKLRNMVLVPEGDYVMGSKPGRSPFENEYPRHPVHLESFYLDRYEVTNEDYKRFCDETQHPYPEYFLNGNFAPGDRLKPVVMVSWSDADAYARWAGKRLPTEFEWEAAAAGVSGKTWPWGDLWSSDTANTREAGEKDSTSVGSYPFDVSVGGIHDLAGNVSEWTQSWYQPYPGNRRKEKEYGEQFKVLRGGSSKASKDFSRSQFRARLPVSYRSSDLGFRCAFSPQEANP